MARKVIAVSFGHLTSFDAGLGEFARRLGSGLAARAPAWREHGIELCFHTEVPLQGALGSEVEYVPYRRRRSHGRRSGSRPPGVA